jgi:hypothetical protein
MTPVFAQMSCDSVGTGRLAHARSFYRIRLVAASSLPQSGNMIDIDVEPLLLSAHCHRP